MPDHRVWIAQCLCPSRHCILATAFDEAVTSVLTAKAGLAVAVDYAIGAGEIDPWCGICRSPAWTIEAAPTPWRSLQEAEPHLRATEQDNLRTRDYLKAERA